ncbi:MAG: cytochrome c biogenesis protein CcdA [Pseudomonadota bacterium]
MLEISGIGVGAAFLAGLISFLSPCVLPLVPAYVSYIAGESLEDLTGEVTARTRAAAVVLSLFFVLGFSTVFVLLGAGATAAGDLLLTYRYELSYVAGAIVIVFGLFMMGVFRIAWFDRDVRMQINVPGGRPVAAYGLGAAFAFGWTPCIGPILGAILAVAATTATIGQGVALLAIYSLGLGVPFLIAAASTGLFVRRMKGLGRWGRRIQVAAGAILVVMGIAMLTGYLADFAFWLLETFPVLATIG